MGPLFPATGCADGVWVPVHLQAGGHVCRPQHLQRHAEQLPQGVFVYPVFLVSLSSLVGFPSHVCIKFFVSPVTSHVPLCSWVLSVLQHLRTAGPLPGGLELDVVVLTTGFWPIPPTKQSILLPQVRGMDLPHSCVVLTALLPRPLPWQPRSTSHIPHLTCGFPLAIHPTFVPRLYSSWLLVTSSKTST